MANDYTVIGSISGYTNRFLPLERVYTDDGINSKVDELYDLKHKDETDIEFMESLYRNSNPDYYLGGWIVRAVIDITLEFAMGDLPTIQAKDDKYGQFCNNLWTNNQSKIYSAVKELGLFGREFVYIGYDRTRKIPKLRPMSSANIVDIRYEDFNDPEEITYIRIREQYQEAEVVGTDEFDDDKVELKDVFYDKIFWKELNPKYKEDNKKSDKPQKEEQWLYKMKILKRTESDKWKVFAQESNIPYKAIPVIEFNQNKLSFDKVGHSDLSGAMKLISVYHQVLESAINNALYNGQPTLKFTGLDTDPLDFVKRMYGDATIQSGDTLDMQGLYEVFGSYYLSGDQDVNWLTTPSNAGSAKEILNLLFYILVQITGIPEWALGAKMEGAWATVKQQSIPLLQKIRAKRTDITDTLLKMNHICYLIHDYYNPATTKVKEFDCKIIWDDVLTNDLDTQLRLIEYMLQKGFITKETAVSMLGAVNDPLGELKKAQKAIKAETEKSKLEDNTETMKKLMKAKSKSLDDEEIEENEEVSGEMVSNVAMRVVKMLFDSHEPIDVA